MRVIPVIDLMRGLVVRGVAGRRDAYRPIESPLCASARPADVAVALAEQFGLPELYVADLDAIDGAEPAWELYHDLARPGVGLLVDAGISNIARAAGLAQFTAAGTPLSGIIVGLESVAAPELLPSLLGAIGAARLIFSLDLKNGEPLAKGRGWQGLSPAAIASAVFSAGVQRMIVLDLADVGMGSGVNTLALCLEIRATWPECELIAGGGVRGSQDLATLASAGCSAALVASALHDGRLTSADVRGASRTS